jgi:hypothetical protein
MDEYGQAIDLLLMQSRIMQNRMAAAAASCLQSHSSGMPAAQPLTCTDGLHEGRNVCFAFGYALRTRAASCWYSVTGRSLVLTVCTPPQSNASCLASCPPICLPCTRSYSHSPPCLHCYHRDLKTRPKLDSDDASRSTAGEAQGAYSRRGR